MWGHMYDTGWNWWGIGFMMLFWAAVLVVAVWAIIRLTTARDDADGDGRMSPPTLSTRELLDRRLAAGEITVEQYTQLRDQLHPHPTA